MTSIWNFHMIEMTSLCFRNLKCLHSFIKNRTANSERGTIFQPLPLVSLMELRADNVDIARALNMVRKLIASLKKRRRITLGTSVMNLIKSVILVCYISS